MALGDGLHNFVDSRDNNASTLVTVVDIIIMTGATRRVLRYHSLTYITSPVIHFIAWLVRNTF